MSPLRDDNNNNNNGDNNNDNNHVNFKEGWGGQEELSDEPTERQ